MSDNLTYPEKHERIVTTDGDLQRQLHHEAVAGKERRIREAHTALTALVECAAAQPVWCDGVEGCAICGAAGDEVHKPWCPVRLALEWLG